MAQVRYTVSRTPRLTDRFAGNRSLLHAAHPNTVDRDRKNPDDTKKQNTRECFLLGFALFWISAPVCVIRGALSCTRTRPMAGSGFVSVPPFSAVGRLSLLEWRCRVACDVFSPFAAALILLPQSGGFATRCRAFVFISL